MVRMALDLLKRGNLKMIKQGRIPTLDYDLLIYVKSDNSMWITPQNPVELYGEEFRGYNWNDERIPEKNITGRDDDGVESWPTPPEESTINDVARCIKPINPEFEVRWDGKEWTEADNGALCNASFAKIITTDDKITYISSIEHYPVDSLSPTNIDHAKILYPEYAWIIFNSDKTGFRIINPFNPRGNGLVPGSAESYISLDNFLNSDGNYKYSSNNNIDNSQSSNSIVNKNPIIFDSYQEFKLWYNSSNSTYKWINDNGKAKPGKDNINDYDRLIYVIEDNQLWICPSDPREIGGSVGGGWGNGWGLGSPTSRADVPTVFKLLNTEFSISWSDDFNWKEGKDNFNINAFWRKIIFNGKSLEIENATESPPENFEDAKRKFPLHAWIMFENFYQDSTEIRLINPYNKSGCGNVVGPNLKELNNGTFLRSDGKWSLIQEKIEFYINNLSSNIHEKLITKLSVFNYITVALENSSPDPIYFYIYKKRFNKTTESWDSNLITQLNLNPNEGVESYIKSILFDNEEFSKGDIVRIECINNDNSLVHTGSINVVIQYEDYL
jgi:hypothetical protein